MEETPKQIINLIIQIFQIIIGWYIIIKIIKKIIENKKSNNSPTLYGKFEKKEKIMTETEIKFYKLLKSITDKLNLTIFTQVALNQIITTNNQKGKRQIGAKSIDFVITDEFANIKMCLELDDYTHQRKDRIKRDEIVNKLFEEINTKLIRIPIEKAFIVERIEKIITESL